MISFEINKDTHHKELKTVIWERTNQRKWSTLGRREMGSSLCLTLDGKREELNVDFVLSIEGFEA